MSEITLYPSMMVTKTASRLGETNVPERGEIREFSARSRKRLLELIHSVTFSSPLLITLTYDNYPKDGRIYHEHLRAFRSFFERKYGKQRVIWKLEFQKRGAPHFHLVTLDLGQVDIPACGEAWCRIAGIEGQEGTWQAFDVKAKDAKGEELRNPAAYISKYVSKDVLEADYEGITHIGRFWGAWHVKREAVVRVRVPTDKIKLVQAALLDEFGLGEHPFYGYNPYSNTLFVGQAGTSNMVGKMLACLERLGYTEVSQAFGGED